MDPCVCFSFTFWKNLDVNHRRVPAHVGPAEHTDVCSLFPFFPVHTEPPRSADRMALCTSGYAGIKQGLPSQAPHRIPNTMEPRTSGLAVTSFLEVERSPLGMDFLANLPALSRRRRRPVQIGQKLLTPMFT